MALEKKLVDLGNFCIRIVQMLGYFPVCIQKSSSKMGEKTKHLTFKFSNIIVFYTIVLLVSSASWEIVYLLNLRSFLRYIKLFGPTERYAHHSYVLVISTLGLFFRISGFWDMKRTLSFWKQNCSTLEKVQVLLGYQIEDNLIDQPEFQSIKGKLRWSILFNLITVSLHIFLVYAKRIYFSFTDETKGWTEDVTFNVGSGFWTLLSLFHVLYSMWLCYFIHIYTAAFSCLSRKIQSLRDNHTNLPGIIYVSEMIGINQEHQPTFLRRNPHPSKLRQFHDTNAAFTAAALETQLNRYMEAFRTLEQQVISFNSFFGGKLILEMTLCITNLVVNSFFITLWLGRANVIQVAQLVVPIMVFLYQLYNFGTVAGRMSLAAGTVANAILESVPFGILGPETMLRMQILTTKIWNDPPVITAKYFFVVNRHLVTSVISAMTTFLVVLVQFKDADNADIPQFFPRMMMSRRNNTNGTAMQNNSLPFQPANNSFPVPFSNEIQLANMWPF